MLFEQAKKRFPMWLRLICLFFLLPICLTGQDQRRIELIRANSLEFDENIGKDAQRLIGNVIFKHKGALMYCDSAYLYNASNSLEAFGSVRVDQGDTLKLFSDKLLYRGNEEVVLVRNNVTLEDSEMTLTTQTLDYDRNSGRAIFYDQGTIVSKENDNTLIACEGVYDSSTEFFYFRDSVILRNPQYLIETDTLHYSNATEIAYFFGPTFIFNKENTIYCENGWYDTFNDLAQFKQNAYIDNGKQLLKGDSLWYSGAEGLGKAYLNVSVLDTVDNYEIRGDYGEYDEIKGKNFVTGRAEMLQFDLTDTLYLHGDTLLAIRDSIRGDRVFAFHGVKFFRNDMQGAADSLVYSPSDSLIQMFVDPILWSEDLQITGDTIQIRTFEGTVENLYVFDHAFMVNKLDSVKYNQIKGKRLTGYFTDNDLRTIIIKGNGQSLYYASEEEESDSTDSTTTKVSYIGVNKAICSNIQIDMKDRKIDQIYFLKKPDGAFYPLEKFPKNEERFEGFLWQVERRPQSRDDIFE